MAQDFSLRYPLIDGSGNFGSIDGDSPAAMRYTETRLSTFAGMLLRDIDRGITDFRPIYDAIGEEPDGPFSRSHLLLNGSRNSGEAMSCSSSSQPQRGCCRMSSSDPTEGPDHRRLLNMSRAPIFPRVAKFWTTRTIWRRFTRRDTVPFESVELSR
jgi:hypothetical protein